MTVNSWFVSNINITNNIKQHYITVSHHEATRGFTPPPKIAFLKENNQISDESCVGVKLVAHILTHGTLCGRSKVVYTRLENYQ